MERKVNAFDTVHFCLEYRQLLEEGAQIQIALDKVDISGGEDVRAKRKNGIIRSEIAVTSLSEKVHKTGKCSECT